MTQDSQENNPDASASALAKRKRGRPRKYPRSNLNYGESAHVPREQNLNLGDNSHANPGNRNQPHQADPIGDANDVMVGQPVHGVIEAAFDAGYLLSVRVGNSDTRLRGVVFKPGHYVPVSADNDVAPNVQMIRRNDVPFPENHNQGQGSRDYRNGSADPAVANQVPRLRGTQVISVPAQTAQLVTSAGSVPVVTQPANSSNGETVADNPSAVVNQAPHLASSKGKQVPEAAYTTNGSTPLYQAPSVGNQVLHSQPQSGYQGLPEGMQSGTGISQPPVEVLYEAEAKSMRLPGMPFEKLLTEVMKRIQPTQSVEAQTEDQPLSIEPLQAVQPGHTVSMPKPFENYRTGKMTELLQAVQENMKEAQASQAEEPATGSTSPETDLGDDEDVQADKRFRASSV